MPTAYLAVPPILGSAGKLYPPILALHGAGVDIFGQQFWTQSIPRNKHSWLVFPSGRTSWARIIVSNGLGWHGPSARDALEALDSLFFILKNNSHWKQWEIQSKPRFVLLGHSNGGQGAWYLASRYPDRILGGMKYAFTAEMIPAAGYIKSQAYVPLTMSRSGHFIDPALRGLLETSLTPDDNDLHLSNLVDIPVLAIHGAEDRNVPTWHSREAISILRAQEAEYVTFQEDAGKDHWYSTVFDNVVVRDFLGCLMNESPSQAKKIPEEFTLTVSDPHASGSLYGWKIESLLLPGR
ncbi:hypothetical protein H0H81_003476 [Sphagnurus paluster]|uniref:Peptidase S9 prolyl oligopeptidase catalytic domain-containing protein n=1 Tax=Sphagnurus paluster TaxID=117069 RepID=A0A9P7FSD8_9AGAR|nr:hypothetical protein H0H81_003476 [Sphagnurus paluster]